MYRFRSAYNLLNGYHELEKQEIYFASLSELNDPLDGFSGIVWKGDNILWKNFIKYYVTSFTITAIQLFSDRSNNAKNLTDYVYVPKSRAVYPASLYWDALVRIMENILLDSRTLHLIKILSSQSKAIGRDQLEVYINAIHPVILNIVMNEFVHLGCIDAYQAAKDIHIDDSLVDKQLKLLESLKDTKMVSVEQMINLLKSQDEDLRLYTLYEHQGRIHDRYLFLYFDFVKGLLGSVDMRYVI